MYDDEASNGEPQLGCATTAQLLTELEVRWDVDQRYDLVLVVRSLARQLPPSALLYRTVDS